LYTIFFCSYFFLFVATRDEMTQDMHNKSRNVQYLIFFCLFYNNFCILFFSVRIFFCFWRREMKWHKTCTTNLGTFSILFFFAYFTIIFVYYFFLFVFFFVCGDERWNDTRHAQQISERSVSYFFLLILQ